MSLDGSEVYAKRNEIGINVRTAIIQQLQQTGAALLKCGQRSGKSVMARSVAKCVVHSYSTIVVMQGAMSNYLYEDICSDLEGLRGKVHHMTLNCVVNLMLPMAVNAGLRSLDPIPEQVLPPLFIMDEVFWTPQSFDLYTVLKQYGHVFAFGSRGPEFDSTNWKYVPGLSFASWEMNPCVKREDCEPECPSRNLEDKDLISRQMFERDYYGF